MQRKIAVAVMGHLTNNGFMEYGTIQFEDMEKGTMVTCNLKGLSPNPSGLHGLHVHESAGNGVDCSTMGEHYDNVKPRRNHGGRIGPYRHLGDLGNVVVQPDGTCTDSFMVENTWAFKNLVNQPDGEFIGRGLVLHANEDDLGSGPNEQSLLTGNSGQRIACGVIQPM